MVLKLLGQKYGSRWGFIKSLRVKKRIKKFNQGFLSEGKRKKNSEKIALWIRANYFIPDAKCFWIKPSVKKINKRKKNSRI